jgi:hypothetical protein
MLKTAFHTAHSQKYVSVKCSMFNQKYKECWKHVDKTQHVQIVFKSYWRARRFEKMLARAKHVEIVLPKASMLKWSWNPCWNSQQHVDIKASMVLHPSCSTACGNKNKHVQKKSVSSMFTKYFRKKKACWYKIKNMLTKYTACWKLQHVPAQKFLLMSRPYNARVSVGGAKLVTYWLGWQFLNDL